MDEQVQDGKVQRPARATFGNNEDYLEQIEERSGRYELKNLGLNSKVSDFAPSFYGKDLIFSTARDSGLVSKNIHRWNNGAFLNLYKATGDDQAISRHWTSWTGN
ncbi:hypothetical protein [Zobellia laminariae]|uniref:hypothetical protein n=1 Tax=Zobellia laminariae TaxID=248906 RepID=UPI0026F45DA4|nr:hypothetical protein [Zobellia laminariae]WKX76583.1 hypothetical protein Q5W13_24295 [Zobellia laminariae]